MYNAETQLVPVTAQQKEAIISRKKEWISKCTKNTMVENALWHIHEVPCFLNNKDCEYIIECAECHGGWTHKRHHNYLTTDIPIKHLKEVTSMWDVLQPRIMDTCKDVYKRVCKLQPKPNPPLSTRGCHSPVGVQPWKLTM